MTIKQKTWVIFQSPSLAVCKLNIFVFEMFRIHFGTRCYSQDFIDLCLFLNSISVLKETEKQPSRFKIKGRQNYFSDHLLMLIKTQICATSNWRNIAWLQTWLTNFNKATRTMIKVTSNLIFVYPWSALSLLSLSLFSSLSHFLEISLQWCPIYFTAKIFLHWRDKKLGCPLCFDMLHNLRQISHRW